MSTTTTDKPAWLKILNLIWTPIYFVLWLVSFPIRWLIGFLIKHPVGFIVTIFILIFAAVIGKNIMISRFLAHFSFPAASVTTTQSKTQNWTPYISAVGNAIAVEGVNINPQVGGLVTNINFISGQMVKKGQPLVHLDSRSEQAQLNSAIAAMKLAQINYNRDLKLFGTKAISKSTVDTDKATLDEKKAMVAQTRAQVTYRTIYAPFSGRLGIRTVNLGQYLSPTDTITNLQTIDPIYVDYNLPESDLGKVKLNQDVEVFSNTYPGHIFKGKIRAIDAKVSNQTRSILVRAVIHNNDKNELIYPGMFTTVHTLLPTRKNLVTIPTTAVTYTLYGNSVYLVQHSGKGKKEKTIAKLHYVTTGEQQGDDVEVTKGLKSGEKIVLDGQVKLYDGATIKIEKK